MRTILATLALGLSGAVFAAQPTINGQTVTPPADTRIVTPNCATLECHLTNYGVNFITHNGVDFFVFDRAEGNRICDLAWELGYQRVANVSVAGSGSLGGCVTQ